MQLERTTVTIATAHGPLPALAVRPAREKGALPGVIVVQEAWGLDDHIEDVAERVATAGYHALAPDLYALGGERPVALARPRLEGVKKLLDEFGPAVFRDPQAREAALARRPSERADLEATLAAMPLARADREQLLATYVDGLVAAVAWLREGPSRERKIGAVGFCMGGALVGRLAVREPALAACAPFYGGPPPVEHAAQIHARMVGFYAGPERDPGITGAVPAFARAMEAAGRSFESHVYPNASHAFFNDTRAAYDVDAARDAWAKTLALFAATLV